MCLRVFIFWRVDRSLSENNQQDFFLDDDDDSKIKFEIEWNAHVEGRLVFFSKGQYFYLYNRTPNGLNVELPLGWIDEKSFRTILGPFDAL